MLSEITSSVAVLGSKSSSALYYVNRHFKCINCGHWIIMFVLDEKFSLIFVSGFPVLFISSNAV